MDLVKPTILEIKAFLKMLAIATLPIMLKWHDDCLSSHIQIYDINEVFYPCLPNFANMLIRELDSFGSSSFYFGPKRCSRTLPNSR